MKRYDLDGGTGYSTHCRMRQASDGEYLKRDEVIDALAELPGELWPSDEALGALGLEWHDLAEAVGGS